MKTKFINITIPVKCKAGAEDKLKPGEFTIIKPKGYRKKKLGPIIKDWVKALRSGKYKQETGVLHKANGGYCCLGVLCKISGTLKQGKKYGESYFYDTGRNAINLLSESNKYYNALNVNGAIPDNVFVYYKNIDNTTVRLNNLTSANDDGMSFEQIAEIIEALWAAK